MDLSDLALAEIPDSLAQLTNLQELSLYNNRIAFIPAFFAQLVNLRGLILDGNQIAIIPDFLAQLSKLENLWLDHNQIAVIPDSLAQLSNLETLSLAHNQIAVIPDSLAQLSNLENLWLEHNQIAVIPGSLARLSNLKDLFLFGNPLPDELLAAAARGTESLSRYLQEVSKIRIKPRTVKLVLLGEPKSGKTTLVEALKGNLQPCVPDRPETIGVSVLPLVKTHPIDGQPMTLAAWDFAGQHIEHATHQFFLTENAVYLVLWNARQGTESGKRDLWYWLELLKMRVREPRFILVATHTESTPADLNLTEINRNYKGCEGHFPVELSTLKGFAALENKILELAAGSPAMRAEWPKDWLAVRDELRVIGRGQPYISPGEFHRVLDKKVVRDPLAQSDLGAQLHQLGEILYFPDNEELSKLVVLNPEWVAERVALVVRSADVRENGGILRKSDLDQIWKGSSLPPEIREHLIALMNRFDLTYSTGHAADMGIVVEALPYATPEQLKEAELPSGRPRMEMIFRFPSLQRHLPPGIPTWGMARAHRFSRRKPWRDAAAFEETETNSQALILASDSAKEIRLAVTADYPPFFFGQMEAILRDTFRRYPGLQPERRIPCGCEPDCSESHLFERVLGRAREGKDIMVCGKSGKDIPIQSLLTGFAPPSTLEGILAVKAEMRSQFTTQRRSQNEQMQKKTCPSVFTLLPSKQFKMSDSWFESATQDTELELTLFCEHEFGWHTTANSVYRFRADREWFQSLKKNWSGLMSVTRTVAPLVKAAGKAAGTPAIELGLAAIEKLPDLGASMSAELVETLERKNQPEIIGIETRDLLDKLIQSLDGQRSARDAKNGGLHPRIVEDGRLLWLCPEHLKLYQSR